MNTTENIDRLLIPVDGPDENSFAEVNSFEIDDFMRLIHNPVARRRLAAEYGGSFSASEHYEKSHGLPRGAIQLALMADDERVQKMASAMAVKLLAARETQDPQQMMEVLKEGSSMSLGVQRLYPQAVDFIIAYRTLTERSREAYSGDYKFYQTDCTYYFQSTTFLFDVIAAVLGGVVAAFVIPVLVFG